MPFSSNVPKSMNRPAIRRPSSRIRVPKLRLQQMTTRIIEATGINSSGIMATQSPASCTSSTRSSSNSSKSRKNRENASSHIRDRQDASDDRKQVQCRPLLILPLLAPISMSVAQGLTIPKRRSQRKPWLELVIGQRRDEVRMWDRSRRC